MSRFSYRNEWKAARTWRVLIFQSLPVCDISPLVPRVPLRVVPESYRNSALRSTNPRYPKRIATSGVQSLNIRSTTPPGRRIQHMTTTWVLIGIGGLFLLLIVVLVARGYGPAVQNLLLAIWSSPVGRHIIAILALVIALQLVESYTRYIADDKAG